MSLHVDLCLFLSRIVASVCRSSLTIYLYVREASLLYTIPVCTNFSRCCQFGNGRFLKVEELLMDKKEKKSCYRGGWNCSYGHLQFSFTVMHCPVLWLYISAFAEQVWSRPVSSNRVQLHILISYPEYRSCNWWLLVQIAAMLPLLYQLSK